MRMAAYLARNDGRKVKQRRNQIWIEGAQYNLEDAELILETYRNHTRDGENDKGNENTDKKSDSRYDTREVNMGVGFFSKESVYSNLKECKITLTLKIITLVSKHIFYKWTYY